MDCGSEGMYCGSREEAIAAWNRRALSPSASDPVGEPVRYRLIHGTESMDQHPQGEWVKWQDVQRLSASPLPQEPREAELTDERIFEIADSDEANPDNTGWGPKFNILSFARALEREIRGAQEGKAGEWRDIETAPKDGSQILLTNGTSVAQGWWEHQEPYIREKRDMEGNYIDQDESDGYDGWLDCDGGMLPEPTHWRPLPAPPTLNESADSRDPQ
jgi:hypothetical protein